MKAKIKHHKPVSAVITVPDPDDSPFTVHAEAGGTLQWRSDSRNYPRFEIQFIGPNPFNTKENASFTGDNLKPVVLHLKKIGEYSYKIKHIKKDGAGLPTGPAGFRVTQCTGCGEGGDGG
jgi:hypothetical protein